VIASSRQQLGALVAFVRNGLLDPRARPQNLRRLVPETLPSGRPPLTFEFAKR
jgi:cytochrome c peroxidase